MSEQTAPTEGTEETNEQTTEFEPIASQDALDKIVQSRIARERAKFADYEELKAAAEKLSQIEEANKTEVEKVAERLAVAEKRAAELEMQVTRSAVAEAKSDPAKGVVIPAALLTGSTKEELEASADALIEFKVAQEKTRQVPNTWDRPEPGSSTDVEFVSQLFGTRN